MLYYNQVQSPINSAIYSLDMVRLNFDSGSNTQSLFQYLNRLSALDIRYEVSYYPSFAQYKYRHLWTIEDTTAEDNSISWSLGLDLGRNAEDKCKGFIEFNPNKCENSVPFKEFLEFFKDCTYCGRELVRYDLAIDIPLARHLAKLIREGKTNYEFKVKDDGVTEYLGQRNTHGRVKLYDKTAESKLDYSLTRLEITLGKNKDVKDVFPKVWLYDEQRTILSTEDSKLSETQFVLAKSIREVENPNEYIRLLPYRIFKKIEPYLSDRVLLLDENASRKIMRQAMSYES